MLARPYHSSDAKGLDELLGFNRAGDVRLDQDEIFVTEELGKPRGVLVYRPGAFVHQLECREPRRLHAEVLANYAIAHARAKGLRSAIFLVKRDNHAMQRFLDSLGATLQTESGDLLYTLTPP